MTVAFTLFVAGLHAEPMRGNFLKRLRWYLRLDLAGFLDIVGVRKLRGKFLHLPQKQMGE